MPSFTLAHEDAQCSMCTHAHTMPKTRLTAALCSIKNNDTGIQTPRATTSTGPTVHPSTSTSPQEVPQFFSTFDANVSADLCDMSDLDSSDSDQEELPDMLSPHQTCKTIPEKGDPVWVKYRQHHFWPGLVLQSNQKTRKLHVLFLDQLNGRETDHGSSVHSRVYNMGYTHLECVDRVHATVCNMDYSPSCVILPHLLQQLLEPSKSEQALDGLKQVMSVKSRIVLPYLIPQLTAPPVNTKALSLLTSVAGDTLTKHLSKILPALLSSLSSKRGTPDEEQELEYCKKVVLSVNDDIGVRTIMEDLLATTTATSSTTATEENITQGWAAVTMLQAFCSQSQADYTEYVPQLFRGLIQLFVQTDESLLLAAWNCLDAIAKKLDAGDMLLHISSVRQAVRFTVSDFKGKELPGFSIPKKGIAPVLPIFREGILNGSQEIKEAAALGLGELIVLTSSEALKPSVVNITGPLIRILGDRFTWNVKVAVLETLTLLLSKVGTMLKPFLPQLQTTFVKALNDPNRSVRLKAAAALGKLIVIHVRVDPLFQELYTGVKTTDDTSVKDTFLQALRYCLQGAGSKMADPLRKQISQTLQGMLSLPEDSTRMTAAGCFGTLCSCLSDADLNDVMMEQLMDTDPSMEWTSRHGRICALGVALKECPDRLWTPQLKTSIVQTVSQLATADRIPICLGGVRAMGYLLKYLIQKDDNSTEAHELAAVLVKSLKNDSSDVKQLVGRVLTYVGEKIPAEDDNDAMSGSGDTNSVTVSPNILRLVVPALVMGTKEKNTMVRAASETALVVLLQLRSGDHTYQTTLASLDAGMQDSLKEVYMKSLKKLATRADMTVIDDIDDTILR